MSLVKLSRLKSFLRPAVMRAFVISSPFAFWSVQYAYAATPHKVTAMDQAQGTKQDVETTRLIRKRLMDDKTLSTQAKNLNIVTLGEKITIGGTVSNERELSVVRQHVSDIAISANIDDRQVKVAKAH